MSAEQPPTEGINKLRARRKQQAIGHNSFSSEPVIRRMPKDCKAVCAICDKGVRWINEWGQNHYCNRCWKASDPKERPFKWPKGAREDGR